MNSIIVALIICITIIISLIVSLNYIKPILDRKYDLKEKEIKNKKCELFMNLSPELMNESIDKYFETYIKRYITYKFISKKILYIKQDEVDNMVKDLTKLINIEISELYIFYIKMTCTIDTDEDLVRYIHSKVMNMAVEAVLNYNSAMM